MKPKIMIADDDPRDREDIESLLDDVQPGDRHKYRIEKFLPKYAVAVTDGEKLLNEALNDQPFDILLLDLDMPEQPGGSRRDGKYEGFRLLRTARELGAALEVVIHTSFPEQLNVLEALRGGASDFMDKTLDTEEKQTRILSAWRRALEKKSDRLLEQRIRQLIPYAERAVAQRFTPCFSHLVQDVVYAAEGIESYAAERYNLDPERDSQDSLMQSLSLHKEAVKAAQRQWRCLQSKLSGGDSELADVTVETLLKEIKQDLEPCLMIKETTLTLVPNNNVKVQSFQNDVGAVLREVITGALSELSNHGNPHTIEVAVNTDDGQQRAEVRFQDDLDPISLPNANTINDGSNVIDDKSFGRLWGLQVAQQLAMRSGGRLHVQPEPERGNLVSCFIPLA